MNPVRKHFVDYKRHFARAAEQHPAPAYGPIDFRAWLYEVLLDGARFAEANDTVLALRCFALAREYVGRLGGTVDVLASDGLRAFQAYIEAELSEGAEAKRGLEGASRWRTEADVKRGRAWSSNPSLIDPNHPSQRRND